jgi:hypothetical protein
VRGNARHEEPLQLSVDPSGNTLSDAGGFCLREIAVIDHSGQLRHELRSDSEDLGFRGQESEVAEDVPARAPHLSGCHVVPSLPPVPLSIPPIGADW